MVISVNGIPASGKSSLIKRLTRKYPHFFVPEPVGAFASFPGNLAAWYAEGNVDDVVRLDLKAFARRNASVANKANVLLDGGYQGMIDSMCSRYQDRLGIRYDQALARTVFLITQTPVSFERVERISILLRFDENWDRVSTRLQNRIRFLSDEELEYLEILHANMERCVGRYDCVLDATAPIEDNVLILAATLGLQQQPRRKTVVAV
jgi:hypothetical protein